MGLPGSPLRCAPASPEDSAPRIRRRVPAQAHSRQPVRPRPPARDWFAHRYGRDSPQWSQSEPSRRCSSAAPFSPVKFFLPAWCVGDADTKQLKGIVLRLIAYGRARRSDIHALKTVVGHRLQDRKLHVLRFNALYKQMAQVALADKGAQCPAIARAPVDTVAFIPAD